MKRAAPYRLVKIGVAIPSATAAIEATLRRRVTAGIALAIFLVGCMGFFSWHSRRSSSAEADLVSHTRAVMQAVQAALQHLTEAEADARDFALTGNTALLAHYQTSQSLLPQDVVSLRELTLDNPSQQRRNDLIEPQISDALELAKNMVAKRVQSNAAAESNQIVETERLVDTVRGTLRTMQIEEAGLLIERTHRTVTERRSTDGLIVAGTLVGIVLLLLAGVAIRREVDISARARAEIIQLNASLEQRVEDRTAALQAEMAERKQVEERLRATEEWSRLLLDSVKDYAIYRLDTEGRVTSWNAGATRINGYQTEEILGKHFSIFYPATEQQSGKFLLELKQAVDKGVFEEEGYRVRKDGSIFWASVMITPMHDAAGLLLGYSKVSRDISERKRAEQEIARLNEELEQRVIQRTAQLESANKELESFTYSVSHDLRAPLRHISGFSKILMEEFGDTLVPEAQRHLQRIQEGTHKMGILVDGMLNLARTGRQAVRLQNCGLNAIVEEVVALLGPETKGREIEWKIGDLPVLQCDPVLIKQVLQNLIANALKFSRTRNPAVIEIGFTADKENTTVFVRDNGVGFNMKYVDKLFGVFQRLHRDEEFEGTGVGLATVHRIIQKHGGQVWAEAEPDGGATFYFTVGTPQLAVQKNKAALAGA